jgi:hypothetical protein
MDAVFQYDQYLLRRQVLALTGKVRVYDPHGRLALFSQQKMFRLREDIRVYADESMATEVLWIQARQILDFAAAYDVFDTRQGVRVGVLRRRGLRSLVRDEWEVLDADGRPLGTLVEDSLTLALLRRFVVGRWAPQNYDLLVGGRRVCDLRQQFHLFRYNLEIDFREDPSRSFDRRLGLAAGILLAIIEGKQED